ncbi:hypothetical protein ACTSKR_10485 [Chitinibacteraceae bacterium HSL-7]
MKQAFKLSLLLAVMCGQPALAEEAAAPVAEVTPVPTPEPTPTPVRVSLSAPADRALVLASVTMNWPEAVRDPFIELAWRGPAGKTTFRAKGSDVVENLKGLPSGKGKLLQVSAAPGDYQLLYLTGSYKKKGESRRVEFWLPLGQRFSVAAGEVIYLGNVHTELDGKPVATLGDQRMRDFNAISEEDDVNDFSNVVLRVPKGGNMPYSY